MTTLEMIQSFKIGMDKVNALSNPSFEPEEILFFLNKAKDRFEENLYLGRNSLREAYDQTERNRKALAKLTKNWSTGVIGGVSPFGEYFYIQHPFEGTKVDLPVDNKFVLREYCVVQYPTDSDCFTAIELPIWLEEQGQKITYQNAKILPITAVRHNDLEHLLQDPFIKPDNNNLLRIDVEDSSHVIIHATNYEIVAYVLQYLRSSATITLAADYELPDWTHQKVVDMAVVMVLENIESQRTQISMLDQIKND